jgi:hypothetical protein
MAMSREAQEKKVALSKQDTFNYVAEMLLSLKKVALSYDEALLAHLIELAIVEAENLQN